MKRPSMKTAALLLAAACAAAGCETMSGSSGVPVTRRQVTDALDSIKRAEAHDGARDPRATELRTAAWKEYDEAKQYAADGNNAHANSMLARAQADADLAEKLAEKFILVNQLAEATERLKVAKTGRTPGAEAPVK